MSHTKTEKMESWWINSFLVLPILVAAVVVSKAKASAIDNGVMGEPEVTCTPSGVAILIHSQKPFDGRIFVKGHSNVQQCSTPVPYVPQRLVNGGTGMSTMFTVPYSTCSALRERQLNPRGVSYSTVIIVSFHSVFITKVDRAYRVQCFYAEAEKAITANLEVSMISTTETVTGGPQMPDCTYNVHYERADGPLVRFARVGDKVVHVWRCAAPDRVNPMPDSEMFGFRVKSCTVDSRAANSTAVPVVDERGCSVDRVVLGEIEYDAGDQLIATADSHVFKFADVSALHFACQIELCSRLNGECDELFQMDCSERSGTLLEQRVVGRHIRAVTNDAENMKPSTSDNFVLEELGTGRLDDATEKTSVVDVHTADVTVLDIDQALDFEQAQELNALLHNGSPSREKHNGSDGENRCDFMSASGAVAASLALAALIAIGCCAVAAAGVALVRLKYNWMKRLPLVI